MRGLRFAANRELENKISKFRSLNSSEITGHWIPKSGVVKRMAKPLVDLLMFLAIYLSLPQYQLWESEASFTSRTYNQGQEYRRSCACDSALNKISREQVLVPSCESYNHLRAKKVGLPVIVPGFNA
jgi:hypothetical protein